MYGKGKGGGGKGHWNPGGGGSGPNENVAELFNKQSTTGINFEEAHKQPVEVTPQDPNCPPIESFHSGLLRPEILRNIDRCGYRNPTPIQRYGIPVALARKDLVACAQTGSGKTAAFLLPTIQALLSEGFNASAGDRISYVGGLVLAPTRELATQICEEAIKFCYETAIRPTVVYGGADFKPQIRALEEGVEILVATPGRFIDHHERGRINLQHLRIFIMDEADRMLDMGFEPSIRQIATKCGMPRKRQTMMFSATFSSAVQRLAQDFVKDYTFMTVGRVGSTHSYIKQALVWAEEQDKRFLLLGILLGSPGTTLVFSNTKQETNSIMRFLREQGFSADAIHSDRTQAERESALSRFKSGQTTILCATDVAARGLDVQGVALVVQYDMPTEIDDCVHRIGRTGRAGNMGIAIGFVNMRNKPLAPDLYALMAEAGQAIPPWLKGMAYSLGGPTVMQTIQFGGQDIRMSSKRANAVQKDAVHYSFDANAYGSAAPGQA
ncbi:DEAD-box ATP-dependent RNA helicase 52B [Diplonema papillatum]|nr:DEAD-box ATP-dependent RNA helicase 52B [Diplonema papillatum]